MEQGGATSAFSQAALAAADAEPFDALAKRLASMLKRPTLDLLGWRVTHVGVRGQGFGANVALRVQGKVCSALSTPCNNPELPALLADAINAVVWHKTYALFGALFGSIIRESKLFSRPHCPLHNQKYSPRVFPAGAALNRLLSQELQDESKRANLQILFAGRTRDQILAGGGVCGAAGARWRAALTAQLLPTHLGGTDGEVGIEDVQFAFQHRCNTLEELAAAKARGPRAARPPRAPPAQRPSRAAARAHAPADDDLADWSDADSMDGSEEEEEGGLPACSPARYAQHVCDSLELGGCARSNCLRNLIAAVRLHLPVVAGAVGMPFPPSLVGQNLCAGLPAGRVAAATDATGMPAWPRMAGLTSTI